MQFDRDMESLNKKLFASTRELLMSFDDVSETNKDKITTYSCKGSGLCHLRTMPQGIDIGFLKCSFIKDKYNLLHGKSKRMRVLS